MIAPDKIKEVRWWHAPTVIAGILIVLLVARYKMISSETNSAHEGPILAVHDWPSLATHFAAHDKAAHFTFKRIQKLSDLMPPSDALKNLRGVVVPLDAVVANVDALTEAGWRIVWICDHSHGVDRVLVAAKNEQMDLTVGDKNWLTLKNTSAAHLLDIYLTKVRKYDNWKHRYSADKLNDNYKTPQDLVQAADEKTALIALQEPWASAASLQAHKKGNELADVTDSLPSPSPLSGVNVLLAKDLETDFVLENGLTAFIRTLLKYPDKNSVKERMEIDPSVGTDLGFDDTTQEKLKLIMGRYEIVNIEQNFEFLYGFGAFKCSAVVGELLDNKQGDAVEICKRLIDTTTRDTMTAKLQDLGVQVPQFDQGTLTELCQSGATYSKEKEKEEVVDRFALGHSEIDKRDKVGFETPREQLNEIIVQHRISPELPYCLIGHGDASGHPNRQNREQRNLELGQDRAAAVIKELLSPRYNGFKSANLHAISLGDAVPTGLLDQAKDRRVEIRQLRFRINGG